MRLGRKYDKLIEVWQTTNVPDGFGGNTVANERIGGSYCNIRTLNAQRMTDLGLNENSLAIEVTLRNRNDIDYSVSNIFFKYKGISYNINTIENKNVDGLELKILAVTSSAANKPFTPNSNTPLNVFPLTFPITLS